MQVDASARFIVFDGNLTHSIITEERLKRSLGAITDKLEGFIEATCKRLSSKPDFQLFTPKLFQLFTPVFI